MESSTEDGIMNLCFDASSMQVKVVAVLVSVAPSMLTDVPVIVTNELAASPDHSISCPCERDMVLTAALFVQLNPEFAAVLAVKAFTSAPPFPLFALIVLPLDVTVTVPASRGIGSKMPIGFPF